MFGCVSALCPERSWRASCPAVHWATSRCVSPETTGRRRGRWRLPTLQDDADTSNTTCYLTANTSLTSCSNRTVTSMSAGKTDTDNNNNNGQALVCERTAEWIIWSSFLSSGYFCMPGLFCHVAVVSEAMNLLVNVYSFFLFLQLQF